MGDADGRVRGMWAAAAIALAICCPAAPAAAAPVAVPNACRYSFDLGWRDQPLTWDVAATPNPAAPGTMFVLGGTVATQMPAWLTQFGFNLGLLKPGDNRIPARAWVAIGGPGGAQTVQAAVEFQSTITTAGGAFQAGTPLTVTVQLPSTAWTAPGAGTAALAQASAGALPAVPADGGGAPLVPLGSFYVAGKLGFFPFQLDCQPGAVRPDGSGPAPQPPAAAATVAVALGAEPTPQPGPAVPPPAPTVVSTGTPPQLIPLSPGLRAAAGAVRLAVRCRSAVPCRGAVLLRSTAPVRPGSHRVPLTIARGRVDLPPDGGAHLTLRLTAGAERLLSGRHRVRVRVLGALERHVPVLPRELPVSGE